MFTKSAATQTFNSSQFRLDAENLAVYTHHQRKPHNGELYVYKSFFSKKLSFSIIKYAKKDCNLFIKGSSHVAHFAHLLALKILVFVGHAQRNSNQDLYKTTIQNLRNLAHANSAVLDISCAVLGLDSPVDASTRITTLENLEVLLRQDIANLRDDNASLTLRNTNIRTENTRLVAQQNERARNVSDQAVQIAQLNTQNADLTIDIVNRQNQLQEVRNDLVATTNQRQRVITELGDTRVELQRAEDNLTNTNQRLRDAMQEIQDLQEELDEVNQELTNAQAQVTELTNRYDALRDINSDEHALLIALSFENQPADRLDRLRETAVRLTEARGH